MTLRLPDRNKIPQMRSRELLFETLSMLCGFVWNGRLRAGEHMWTIPVNHERDFDSILCDAFNELEDRRRVMKSLEIVCEKWDK